MSKTKQQPTQPVPIHKCIAKLQQGAQRVRRKALAVKDTNLKQDLDNQAYFTESVIYHLSQLQVPTIGLPWEYWEKKYPGFMKKPPEERGQIINAELKAITDWLNADEEDNRTPQLKKVPDDN